MVAFDGFKEGVLIEAKGPGYAQFLKADGSGWQEFFTGWEPMRRQLERQVSAAAGTPVQWHVAEEGVARFIRKYVTDQGLPVEVIWTAATP